MLLSNREFFFGNLLDDGHTLFMGRNEFSVAISISSWSIDYYYHIPSYSLGSIFFCIYGFIPV